MKPCSSSRHRRRPRQRPIVRNTLGVRMDRHAGIRRLKHLAAAGIRAPRMHPHKLRHTFVTTMLDDGVSLRDVQIAAGATPPRWMN